MVDVVECGKDCQEEEETKAEAGEHCLGVGICLFGYLYECFLDLIKSTDKRINRPMFFWLCGYFMVIDAFSTFKSPNHPSKLKINK